VTARVALQPVLDAPDPPTWAATHLRARLDLWEADAGLTAPPEILSTAELLADDAAVLRRAHAQIVADGTPPPAAATYLVDWYPGTLASVVGYVLATAGAGMLADGGGPEAVRWHLHPDGWPFRIDLPVHCLVLPDHPWADDERAQVVPDADDLLERTVRSLVSASAPIVDVCHGLARVGAAGLWNEVADAIGRSVAFQHLVEPTPAMLAVLRAAVAVDVAPWKASPRLGFAPSEALGPVHVVQKGGCCLAYTASAGEPPDPEDPGLTPYHRAYLRRFPVDPDRPRYCSTCSFRDAADTNARQVFWHEHHAPDPTPRSEEGARP